MQQAVLAPPAVRRAPRPSRTLVAGATIVFVAALAILALLNGPLRSQPQAGVPVPINPAVEARWGVRVTQVAMTGDGGLVDFRFIALDPDKALAMMQDVNNLPILRTEDSGKIVNSAANMAATHDLRAGQTYFLLYRNPGGAIRPGTPVTILFGDLKIEHVLSR